MPTYEYACKECGEHLEVVQSFRDEPLAVCPSCGGPLRKVFGAIGVVLKGSGFYRTDNRSSGRAKGDGPTTDGRADKSEKTETKAEKSDTKSEKKADAKSGGGSTSKSTASKSESKTA